ncbi:MAG: F0F1 ATP synthase subunit gamma [Desulfobacterales bacterium]|nr:F0F1 ATP synthase subunit gamma [Desulfobacterales bacterium]
MLTIESLKKKIKSLEDLQSVVKTMKAIAAVSIRQYQRAVESLAEYNRSVEMGLQVVLRKKPQGITIAEAEPARRLGVIIFGSEQGMVGQFNELIASYAINRIRESCIERQDCPVLAIGMRVIPSLEGAGQAVGEHLALPGSVASITPAVHEVVLKIESWRSERDIDRIVLFYNRPLSGASYRPCTLRLLPIHPEWLQALEEKTWPSRVIPTFTMDWDRLFSSLVRQYIFVSLHRAFAESLASENAGRLASMQVAEKNIEDRLDELHAQFHQQRQASISEELFDIVAGFEALMH